MINFATLQGLTIPEGVVTQITDASGRVLWKLQNSKPVVLQVAKVTSDTYAGETTYTGEQFILLDIYPKTNGTVKVTYGGLTKTITDTSGAENPNAQGVYFGTFNGVSDSVTTPASGELTIEGDYVTFSQGSYTSSSKGIPGYCGCVTAVTDLGSIKIIADNMLRGSTSLTSISFPDGLTSIGANAFNGCTSLVLTSLPNSLTSIGANAFNGCTSLALTSLPNSLTSIGNDAFSGCTSLALTSLPSGLTSIEDAVFWKCTSLVLTSLPSGLTSIGANAFNGCTSLVLTSLPSGLTSIGANAFNGCENVNIANIKVANIGDSAFKLTRTASRDPLIISNGTISIDRHAFTTGVTGNYGEPLNITIASTVTFIGQSAFYAGGHTDAKRIVTMQGTTPPTLGVSDSGTLYWNFDKPEFLIKIIVPKGCSAAYKADASWIAAGYVNKIVEAS